MRRMHVIVTSLVALSLAACGSASAAGGGTSGSKLDATYSNALPPASQLAIGTLKLSGTPQAVDVTQAAKLLPLWQAFQSLLRSSTAAEAEFKGLERQIEEGMTPAQLEAIAKMRLTTSDTATAFAQQGPGAFDGGTPFPRSGSNGSAGGQGNRPGGGDGFFGGGGGGGGFFGPGGGQGGFPGQGGVPQTPNAQLRSTAQAQAASQQKIAGVNARMVNMMVRYLERVLGPTPTPAA